MEGGHQCSLLYMLKYAPKWQNSFQVITTTYPREIGVHAMPQSIIKERKMISDVYRPFSSLSVALLREASAGQSNGSVSNCLLRLGRRFRVSRMYPWHFKLPCGKKSQTQISGHRLGDHSTVVKACPNSTKTLQALYTSYKNFLFGSEPFQEGSKTAHRDLPISEFKPFTCTTRN